MKQALVIIAVLAAAGAAYFLLTKGGGGNVALAATASKESYAPGEHVELTLNLTNAGKRAVCVSRSAKGTVRFLSVTRDGEPVASRTSRSYYITALPLIMQAELAEVAAGGSMDIAIASAEDPGLGAEALSTTAVDATAGKTTFYDISQPGAYEIAVAYEYEGKPSDECKSVFTGSTNTATVSFTVAQP